MWSFIARNEAAELMLNDCMKIIERQKNPEPVDFIPKPLALFSGNYLKYNYMKDLKKMEEVYLPWKKIIKGILFFINLGNTLMIPCFSEYS